ncbi:restriction endonuclease subunit S [Flavilitoribacter nigricans]|nr:restriction endonuclease subunit S [Flavilitoribacter nigricans]
MVKTKNKMVPVLRFPGFQGEWKVVRLKDISSLITKGTTPKYFSKSGVNYVKIESLEGININIQKCLFIDEKVHFKDLKRSILEKNDVLFAIAGATIGKLGIVTKEILPANTNQALAIIRLRNPQILNFTLQILQSRVMNKYIYQSISVGAQPNLNLQQIGDFKFFLPTLPEQQKIAHFLTAIDTKIQQLTQKKALLEAYKKGVMQQIFKQEIRFRDEGGKAFPDWEERKFGEVFNFLSTNSFSRSLLNYEEGQVKNIHYGDIHTKFKSNLDLNKEQVPYVNADVDLSKISQKNFCQEGDLIIADASEDYNDIGKAIEVRNLNGERLIAGLHTHLVRDKGKQTVPGFKGYLLQSHFVRLQIMKLATGISVLGISKTNLSKVNLILPCLREQQKIVKFLTSLDEKTDRVFISLEDLQTFKKGLLQKMFV